MLFVCLIVADVTMDGACDGLAQSAAGGITITSGPFDGGSDACAPLCVADCYCCSRSVTASLTVLRTEAGPSATVPAFSPTAPPDGVHPVPYHPPLRLV
jgi:hypothetical protein